MTFYLKKITFLVFCSIFCLQIFASMDTINNRKKIGLVLSGGGAKGFAHIGVLKVLEKKNISIDYIGGTSMGAIVGGFYAMGYTAKEIESILSKQDWEKIFVRELERRNIPLYERKDIERYIVSFSLSKKGIELPKGFAQKKNILQLLSQTAKENNSTIDFKNDLTIPFFCIATDFETGEEVIIEKGNFPKSIYASMAIPAVFPPIELNDRLLVDGGIVNNFPVDRMKEKDVDLIIGVDVQYGARKRNEINSFNDIISQLSIITSIEDTIKKDYCDIYIRPELNIYSTGDFDKMDPIILEGEKSANKILSSIVSVGDTVYSHNENVFEEKYLIKQIEIHGIPDLTTKDFVKIFKLDLPGIFTKKTITKLVRRIYERYNLTSLFYSFEGKDKEILQLTVEQKEGNTFNIGLNFDQDQGLKLLLNTSFYNFWINQSKLSLDFRLSQNPRFTAKYNLHYRNLLNFSINADVNNYEFKNFDNEDKLFSVDLISYKFDINAYILFKNSYSLGAGIRLEYFDIEKDVFFNDKSYGFYTNNYFYLSINTFDDNDFPNFGQKLYAEIKILNDEELENKSTIAYLEWNKTIKLFNKFNILPSIYGRAAFSDKELPKIYNNYLKGYNKSSFFDHHLPFIGSVFLQPMESKTMIFGLDFRYNIYKNHYITAKGNIGLSANEFDNLIDESVKKGIGLTYSYKSFFGPVEITIAKSNLRKKATVYFNAGFWF